MSEYITDDIEISSDDSDEENSNEENSDNENSEEKNWIQNANAAKERIAEYKKYYIMLISSYSRNTHTIKLIYEAYKNIFYKLFFLYIKMTNKYYQEHKEKLQKEGRERYQSLSKEQKSKKVKKSPRKILEFYWKRKRKKDHYNSERNKNISEEQKQKLNEHVRNYYLAHKKITVQSFNKVFFWQ